MKRFDLSAMTALDKLLTLIAAASAAVVAAGDFIHSDAVQALAAAGLAFAAALGIRPLGPRSK